MVIAVWNVNPNDRKCQPHLRYVHLMFFMIDGVAFITVLYKFLVAMFFFFFENLFTGWGIVMMRLSLSKVTDLIWNTQCYISERMHMNVKTNLAIMCEYNHLSWPRYLDDVAYALNTLVHATARAQQYFAFFSRHVRSYVEVPLSTLESIVG